MTLSLFLISYLYISTSTVFYVDPSATETSDGSSWNYPFNTLEEALSTMSSTDQIWLKSGTYIPLNPSDRTDCFISNYEATIYGGFLGTESNINERSTSTDPSIISGDIGELDDNTDNCYHVISYTKSLTLDNVIIENGNANHDNYNSQVNTLLRYGGAIQNTLDTQNQIITLTLNNVVIRNNTAINGGAIFLNGRKNKLIVTDSIFEYNTAINGVYEGGYGGALYSKSQANIDLFNTQFNHNFANFKAGAIYQDYGAVLVADTCIFDSNKVNGYGGAIFGEDRNSQTDGTFPVIKASTFTNNEAGIYGGAICWYNRVEGTLINNNFEGNKAGIYGGAIALFNSDLNSTENTFIDNVATSDSNTNNEYNEPQNQYTEIDSTLSFNINTELNTLYSNIPSDADVHPFDSNDDLCFVDIDNTNNIKDGSSWLNAYNNIQECLDALNTVSGGEMWVKTGTYVPTTVPDWKIRIGKTNDLMKSFSMYDNIRIYGGFSGTETDRNSRNWKDNPTYLSCQLPNNRQCKQILNAADNTVVDGFIFVDAGSGEIRRRLQNSISVAQVLASTSTNLGAGVYSNSTTITVVNSIFHKLFTIGKGGGAYCVGMQGSSGTIIKSPTFINVAFLGNRAGARGGGISADAECEFECKSCKFESNSAAGKGGAVYLDFDCDPIFENSKFIDNYAMESGGCIAADGQSFTTFIGDTYFEGNSAEMEGGCLYAGSGVGYGVEQGFHFIETPVFVDNYLSNIGIGHIIYGWPYNTFIFDTNTITTTIAPTTTVDTTCISESDIFIYKQSDVTSSPDTTAIDEYMNAAKTRFKNNNAECVSDTNFDFVYSAKWLKRQNKFRINLIVCCGNNKLFTDDWISNDMPSGYGRYDGAMNFIYTIDDSEEISVKEIVVWCIVGLLGIGCCIGMVAFYFKIKNKVSEKPANKIENQPLTPPANTIEKNINIQISEMHNGEDENK